MLLIKVGQYIGAIFTVGIVVFTGVVGAYLARLQGMITLANIQNDVNNGRMPADRLFDGLIILSSGLLLLTPGFITDILGFAGLFPVTRALLKVFIRDKIQKMVSTGQTINFTITRRY